MKILSFGLLIAGLVLFLSLGSAVQAQIVFKIPNDVFPMDWNKSGFKGTLMLQKESPSGVFIAYPNQGESSDELRERAAKFIAPMVSDAKAEEAITFEIKTIKSNKDDIQDRGRYYLYKGQKTSMQILFFERQTPAAVVLYGYFAQKDTEKKKRKIWVGDDLKLPKLLSKFVDSFHTN